MHTPTQVFNNKMIFNYKTFFCFLLPIIILPALPGFDPLPPATDKSANLAIDKDNAFILMMPPDPPSPQKLEVLCDQPPEPPFTLMVPFIAIYVKRDVN